MRSRVKQLEAFLGHEGRRFGASQKIEEKPRFDDEQVGEEGVKRVAVFGEGERGGRPEVGFAAVGIVFQDALKGGGGVGEAFFLE